MACAGGWNGSVAGWGNLRPAIAMPPQWKWPHTETESKMMSHRGWAIINSVSQALHVEIMEESRGRIPFKNLVTISAPRQRWGRFRGRFRGPADSERFHSGFSAVSQASQQSPMGSSGSSMERNANEDLQGAFPPHTHTHTHTLRCSMVQ